MSAQSGALTELLGALEAETDLYDRLLSLAERQGRYLVHRRERRLHTVAQVISNLVPRGRRLSRCREELLAPYVVGGSVGGNQIDLTALAAVGDEQEVRRVRLALARLTEVGLALYRKNFQNHQLAGFSIGLVREEMRAMVGVSGASDEYTHEGEQEAGVGQGIWTGRA